MEKDFNFKEKSFAIFGLGITGKSALNFLKKKKVKQVFTWDDNVKVRKKTDKKFFFEKLNTVDHIIISPGINVNYSKNRKYFIKNKNKLITDLDLFFLLNKKIKSIVVTGTNGKSTTCSLIYHVLKKNNIKSELVGNIGKPILSSKFQKNKIYIIEASSYQLSYSKYLKPNYAIILNISGDHIDWHGSMKNYIDSKFKVFENQSFKDKSILKSEKLKKIYKKKKFKGKLIFLKKKSFDKYHINNLYLRSEANIDNVEFAYQISKSFKIKKKNFLNSLDSFKGLPHRHEIFFKKRNCIFINDSKATSFDSTKYALKENKNILWILGGLPKKNDKIKLNNYKNKIIKAYIIGKKTEFFKKQLRRKIKFDVKSNLKEAIKIIFNLLNKYKDKDILTVLFSPSSSSYDQYKNFMQRGNHFKRLIKIYANKHF